LIGIVAGTIVSLILTRWPGIAGFGVLHLCAFAALAASYASFAQIRETTLPPKRTDREGTWIGFVHSIPAIVRADRRLGLYLLNRACAAGSLVLLPFLSVHALRTLGKPASFLGILLTAQMAGMVTGNLLGGWFGDKRGARLILIWSAIAYLGLCLWAPVAKGVWEYYCVFGIMGLATSLEAIGVGTMSLELSPVQKRVAYLSIISIFGMAGMTFMTLGNIALQRAQNIFTWQAIIAGVFIAASLFVLVRIQEPRVESAAHTRPRPD
jgi:MFS family permease